MLSNGEKHEIEADLKKFPSKRAACIEALAVVHRHRRWLSDEAIRDVAQALEMAPAEVSAIASFYNLVFRRPTGRHVILLCDSVSCWIMDGEKVRELLIQRLGIQMGETTFDGRFTLLPIVCLGACDHAPVMMIDDDLHHDVSAANLDGILARYP
jgi:NADH-quinone oxidoreductase subunit E